MNMTVAAFWIALPVIGFFLALLPKPKTAFTLLAVVALGLVAYMGSRFEGEQRGVLLMVVGIGGPWAAGLVGFGALLGSLTSKLATAGKRRYVLLISAVAVGTAAFAMVNSTRQAQSMAEEKQLAVEYVKQRQDIMQEAGGKVSVSLVSSLIRHDRHTLYDIGVHGEKTMYAIVEVSRASGKPVFTLACVTPLYMESAYRTNILAINKRRILFAAVLVAVERQRSAWGHFVLF